MRSEKRAVPSKLVLYPLLHLSHATVSPCIHSNLDKGPNMVLHQSGYVQIFSSKVMNITLSLNQITQGEMCDII